MSVENIQDAIALNGSIRMGNDQSNETLDPMIQDGYLDYSNADLQGDIEYLVVDGTLPIEPFPLSRVLAERSPGCIAVRPRYMELDLKAMTLEAVRSMGISDIDRLRIPQRNSREMAPAPLSKWRSWKNARSLGQTR